MPPPDITTIPIREGCISENDLPPDEASHFSHSIRIIGVSFDRDPKMGNKWAKADKMAPRETLMLIMGRLQVMLFVHIDRVARISNYQSVGSVCEAVVHFYDDKYCKKTITLIHSDSEPLHPFTTTTSASYLDAPDPLPVPHLQRALLRIPFQVDVATCYDILEHSVGPIHHIEAGTAKRHSHTIARASFWSTEDYESSIELNRTKIEHPLGVEVTGAMPLEPVHMDVIRGMLWDNWGILMGPELLRDKRVLKASRKSDYNRVLRLGMMKVDEEVGVVVFRKHKSVFMDSWMQDGGDVKIAIFEERKSQQSDTFRKVVSNISGPIPESCMPRKQMSRGALPRNPIMTIKPKQLWKKVAAARIPKGHGTGGSEDEWSEEAEFGDESEPEVGEEVGADDMEIDMDVGEGDSGEGSR